MSMSSLPEDIQVDIFLKLPVNCIGISRCVCKVWCSQLSNPKFNKLHLNHTISPRFIVHKKDSWRPMISSADDGSINSSAASGKSPKVVYSEDFERVFPFANNNQIRMSHLGIIGSCNGFLCLSISCSMSKRIKENKICLWNTSTGEYKETSLPSLFDDHNKAEVGFGYDSNIDDNKVVRIREIHYTLSEKSWSQQVVEVYTLKSNSWRSFQPENSSYVFPSSETGSGFLFNGVLHWRGFRTTGNRVIVNFDINNDKLGDFSLPEVAFPPMKLRRVQSGALYDILDTSVGVLRGSLCLAIDVGNSRTDIWVMQEYGVNESWTKLFSTLIYCCFTRPHLCLQDRKVIMDTEVGLVLFEKRIDRYRDVKFNLWFIHALLLWRSSSDAE